jgi:hypothetical protein
MIKQFIDPIGVAAKLRKTHVPFPAIVALIFCAQLGPLILQGMSIPLIGVLAAAATANTVLLVAGAVAIVSRLMGGCIKIREVQDVTGLLHVPLLLASIPLMAAVLNPLHPLIPKVGVLLYLIILVTGVVVSATLIAVLNKWETLAKLRGIIALALPLYVIGILPFSAILSVVQNKDKGEEVPMAMVNSLQLDLEDEQASAGGETITTSKPPMLAPLPDMLIPTRIDKVTWYLPASSESAVPTTGEEQKVIAAFQPNIEAFLRGRENHGLVALDLWRQRQLFILTEEQEDGQLSEVTDFRKKGTVLTMVGKIKLGEGQVSVALRLEKDATWVLHQVQIIQP